MPTRTAVITGAGRAFSAGGDFNYLDETASGRALRQKTIKHGRDLVIGMLRCGSGGRGGQSWSLRSGWAATWRRCPIVYAGRDRPFRRSARQIGLVAADGGPLVWVLADLVVAGQGSLPSGVRIAAERAVALGLANHVVADPLSEAIACAKKLMELPRQAVEATKRLMNIQLENAVMASLGYANGGVRVIRHRRLQPDRRRPDRQSSVLLAGRTLLRREAQGAVQSDGRR